MSEPFSAVEVIIRKRDGGELSDAGDRLGGRRLHPRRGGRRADVGAGDGDPAQRHGPPRDRALDGGDDRVRRADGLQHACPGRPPTSTRPAASATRSRCRWRRSWRPAASPCPQLSGRGLGHTGGTLDKLESIPGWRAALSNEEMFAQLESVGAVICAAGDGLAPADKKLYALRDVTGHRRGDPADRDLDHEQEDRRGHRRAGARRQGRLRGVHEERRAGPRAGRDHGRARHGRRRAHRRPADRHGDAARAHRRQRHRGRGVGRGPGRRRPGRRGRADPGAGPRDARRRRPRRRRPGRQARRRLRDGRLEGDDPRPGRRPGRGAAGRPRVARRHGARHGHADPARRPGGRHRRLAARRRPVPQGGPGPGRRRRALARPARATRSPRASR